MARKLTETLIRNRTRPGEEGDQLAIGLRLRVTSSGRKVWYFRYKDRVSGNLKKLKLGEWPDMELIPARTEALRQRSLLDEGKDPQSERNAEREAVRAAREEESPPSVGELVRDFLTYADRNFAPSTVRDYRRYLEGEVLVRWKNRVADNVRRGEVIDLLDAVSIRGHRAAGHLLTAARACWYWGLERERVGANPWAGLKNQAKKFKGGQRERTLSDVELRQLLLSLPESSLSPVVQSVIRLALYTGCRPGEAAGARWTELDLESAIWTIPASRTKTRQTYRISLSTQTISLLTELRAGKGRGRHRYLFPSQRRDPKVPHVRVDGLANRFRAAGLGHTPHDLRRSVSTGLQRLGCPTEVRDRILNHALASGVRAHYDHHQFDDESREWLQRWSDHLEALAGENVVPISSSRV